MDKCLDPPGRELTSPRTGLIYQSLGKKPILHKEVRVIWVRKEQVKGMRLPFGRHLGALEGGAPLLLPWLTSTRRAGAPCPSADRELLGGGSRALFIPVFLVSAKCLVHSGCSISVWWINEKVNEWLFFLIPCEVLPMGLFIVWILWFHPLGLC